MQRGFLGRFLWPVLFLVIGAGSIGAAAAVMHDGQLGRAGASGLHCFAGFDMVGLFLICTYTKPCHRNSRARR
jgi:hypothetical protein